MTDDLISRAEAIEALGEEPAMWREKDEYEMGLNNQWHSDRNAIMAVPSVESRWIPVTERLPEKNTLVLITTSKGIVVQVMFFGENMNGHMVWRSFGGEYVYWDEEVTAWMPLPTPWKGESDG